MKLYLSLAVYSITVAFSVASMESFDNVLLSYGDIDRCNFGRLGRRSKNSPSINRQRISVTEKNASPNDCVQLAEQKERQSDHILHAVEAAEKTIISAVRNEVDTLFNDKDHPQIRNASTSGMKDNTNRRSRRNRRLQPQVANVSDRNRFGWGLDQSANF